MLEFTAQLVPGAPTLAGHSCRLSPGKSSFSLGRDGVMEIFGSSKPAREGRAERQSWCQHPNLVASWPQELCV